MLLRIYMRRVSGTTCQVDAIVRLTSSKSVSQKLSQVLSQKLSPPCLTLSKSGKRSKRGTRSHYPKVGNDRIGETIEKGNRTHYPRVENDRNCWQFAGTLARGKVGKKRHRKQNAQLSQFRSGASHRNIYIDMCICLCETCVSLELPGLEEDVSNEKKAQETFWCMIPQQPGLSFMHIHCKIGIIPSIWYYSRVWHSLPHGASPKRRHSPLRPSSPVFVSSHSWGTLSLFWTHSRERHFLR